jgi:hypothetical protein
VCCFKQIENLVFCGEGMGPAILIRHGDIERNSRGATDDLTPRAQEYAKRLPCLLEEHGFSDADIDVVYFDSSIKYVPSQQKKLPIQRCRETVKHIRGAIHRGYHRSEIRSVLFSSQNAAKTIVICYQSETLRDFPNVDSQDLFDFMIADCPKQKGTAYKKCTDPLYEQILILDVTGSGLTKKIWIDTGTCKGEV